MGGMSARCRPRLHGPHVVCVGGRMKQFDFIKQALIFMALGVGSGFLGVGTLCREEKPNAAPPAAAGRGAGAAAARGPGWQRQLRRARPLLPQPPPAGAAASAARPSVPRRCEPAERSAHSCLLRACPCLIPPQPGRGCQGSAASICCPAALLGRLRVFPLSGY